VRKARFTAHPRTRNLELVLCRCPIPSRALGRWSRLRSCILMGTFAFRLLIETRSLRL
jgi:hypothetical protein